MRRIISGLGLLGMMALAGCTTMSAEPNTAMVPQLQTRVGDLERQLDMKDQEIADLKYQVRDLSYEVERVRTQSARPSTSTRAMISEPPVSSGGGEDDSEILRVDVSAEQLQTALKKAGYYNGAIDGKIGSGTKSGIEGFQKDHGLKVDGVVGKKTWEELKVYLN